MTALTRSTPLRKRSPKKRRRAAVCSRQRCSGRPVVGELCIRHAEKLADDLFSRWVRDRDNRCTNPGFGTPCGGDWQAAHVVGRRNHTTRFDPDNVHTLCRNHHALVDQHMELGAKYRWAVSLLGEGGWQRLMERSRITTPRLVAVTEALERLA